MSLHTHLRMMKAVGYIFSTEDNIDKTKQRSRKQHGIEGCGFLSLQPGVPHCVSYTTVNQRNQEIKHLKGFSEHIFMLLIFLHYSELWSKHHRSSSKEETDFQIQRLHTELLLHCEIQGYKDTVSKCEHLGFQKATQTLQFTVYLNCKFQIDKKY